MGVYLDYDYTALRRKLNGATTIDELRDVISDLLYEMEWDTNSDEQDDSE